MTPEEIKALIDQIASGVMDATGKSIEELEKKAMERIREAQEKTLIASQSQESVENKKTVAGILSTIVRARGDLNIAEKMATQEKRDDIAKAMQLISFEDGGAFAIPQFSDEIFGLWTPKSAVIAAGANVVPLAGSLGFRKVTSGPTLGWTGEGQRTKASNEKTGQVTLQEKYVNGCVPYSNKLIRAYGASKLETVILNDVSKEIARVTDVAYLNGKGTQYQPKGLSNWALTNKWDMSTSTLSGIEADVKKMLTGVQSYGDVEKMAFFASPKFKNYLMFLVASGVYPYRASIEKGVFLGVPLFATANMPVTMTAGGELTGGAFHNLILADMTHVYVGDGNMSIRVLDQASYTDANGDMQSLAENDETGVFVDYGTDLVCRDEKAIAVVKKGTWA